MNWAGLKRTAAQPREGFKLGAALKTVHIGVRTCCQDSCCCQGNLAEEQSVSKLHSTQSNMGFDHFCLSVIWSLLNRNRAYGMMFIYCESL